MTCTEERFLSDMAEHSMEVLEDNGVCRRLRFSNNGSFVYQFNIITWPGYLAVTGDCGDYLFSRTEDMFDFFRMRDGDWNKRSDRKLNLNPGYWEEKCRAASTGTGIKQFSAQAALNSLEHHITEWFSDNDREREHSESEIRERILECENEHQLYNLMCELDSEGYDYDLADGVHCTEYTFRYIWCLYAIVYAIQEYDKSKQAEAA